MKTSLSLIALAGITALAMVGCGRGESGYTPQPTAAVEQATIEPGNEASLFPLTVGNRWTFEQTVVAQRSDGQSANEEREVTFQVKSVNPIEGGVAAEIEIVDKDGNVVDITNWRVTSAGIYQSAAGIGAQRGTFEPPQPIIMFPLEQGKKFEYSGRGPRPIADIGNFSTVGTILGQQPVDTAMGPISAYAVEIRSTFNVTADGQSVEVRSESTTWWAPDIGLVRITQVVGGPGGQSLSLFRLKDYTLQ